MAGVFTSLQRLLDGCLHAISSRLTHWTKPLGTSLPLATLADLGKSKSQLIAENALLRQQLIVLRRQVKRPTFTRTDRILLVLLARLVHTWQNALLIVQPDTLLRGPRELFRLYWKRKSKAHTHKPKVAPETIALIREMAKENRRLRCRADSRRIVETGLAGQQAHHPEVHARSSRPAATRSKVEHVSAQSRRSGLGMRLLAGHRPFLSFSVCLLHHRTALSQSYPCGRHSLSYRCLDSTTTAGSDSLWTIAKVSHS